MAYSAWLVASVAVWLRIIDHPRALCRYTEVALALLLFARYDATVQDADC